MGNTASDLQEATKEVEQQIQQVPEVVGGVKLYRFNKAATAGSWQLVANAAQPRFYDNNQDSNNKSSDFMLEIEAGDIDSRADDSLQYVADASQKRVTFAASGVLWALKFPDPVTYTAFMKELEDNVFYNTYGFGKDSKKVDKEFGDFKDMFFNAAEQFAEAPAPMDSDDRADQPAPGEIKGELKEKAAGPKEEGTPIQGLIVGANERSYLLHGDSTFGVLRNVEGGVEDAEIAPFSFTPLTKGKRTRARTPTPGFTPTKVLMASSENYMNMLGQEDTTKLYRGDIEYQKIVSEWNFNKDTVEIPQTDIANENKAAQLYDVNTFLGLDANRLARWDMRTPGGVVQTTPEAGLTWAGGKDFARGTNFTCMATSGDGYVVVGSKDGRIRLYNGSTLTQAKTSIPGLGKAITAVDVTYDGRFVLATTDSYLMVVKTTWEQNGKECSGFTERAGGKLQPPRLLRLKPEDAALANFKPFKKAHFTWVTEQGKQERWIVASCGNYSVLWNFRTVKMSTSRSTSFGGLPTVMQYHMNRKEEDVVDSNFIHERYTPAHGGRHKDSLVVATPHQVFSLNQASSSGDEL